MAGAGISGRLKVPGQSVAGGCAKGLRYAVVRMASCAAT